MNDKAMTVREGESSGDQSRGSQGPPRPTVDAHLWVCSGKNVGRRYRVDEHPRVLGRALESDIVVEDERASQRHACISVANGKHVVEDLGSTNGTFVNNQRVGRATLGDGDLVQIGETIFEYLSFEERTQSTTAQGTSGGPDVVPPGLRSGAQHVLRRVRRDQVEMLPADPNRDARRAAPGSVEPVLPGAPAYPHGPMAGGGMYPPYPPPYGGHYPGYLDGDDDESEDEPARPAGADLVATLLRLQKIAALYVPYWPMAVAFAFVGVMLGALHFRLNPPSKNASFQIVLRTAGTAADVVGGGFQASQNRLQFFSDQVVERFRAPPIVRATLERIQGEKVTSEDVAEVMEELNFYRIGQFQSNQYGGFMSAPKEDFAVRYLNTHLDIFLEREIEMGLSQVKADVGFFGQEVKNAARALEEAEQALSSYKASHPDALPEQAKSNYDLLFGLQQRRATLEQEIAALDASVRENRRQLARTKRLHTTAYSTANPYRRQIAQVNSRIAQAKAAGKGDEHPDLRRLRGQLEELQALERNQAINKPSEQVAVNTTYTVIEQQVQQDTAQLKALRQQRKEVEADLEEQRSKISRLPKAEAEYQELARAYETAQDEYSVLVKKLRNADLQLQRERALADARHQVVVEPYIEHKPLGKARRIRLAAGGIGGLALAFMIASGLLFRSGRLTFSLLLGREVALDALTKRREPGPDGPELAEGARPALPERASGGADLVPTNGGDRKPS